MYQTLQRGMKGPDKEAAKDLAKTQQKVPAKTQQRTRQRRSKKGGPGEPPSLNFFFCAAWTIRRCLCCDLARSIWDVLGSDAAKDYLFLLPDTATVRERAFVTNRLRLTPSFSARSTRAWCKDFGKRTVNLPLNFM
jgi:hypothetical protein